MAEASDTEPLAPDHAVAELSAMRPRLRRDLRFTFQELGGESGYVLEDLARRKYFQLGLAEYRFLQALDGHHSAREALAENARVMGKAALNESRAQSLLSWLVENELTEAATAGQEGRRRETVADREGKRPSQLLQKIFFLKIPLGNPDRCLNRVAPWLRWSFAPLAVTGWCLLLAIAGIGLASHWAAFMEATSRVILPGNWLMLLLSFASLKLVHELWHGVAAKRYGSPVPEWGVRLLAFISPLTYIDATATWRLPSRGARMVVAAAGMYIELFIAAVAVLVWINAEAGWISAISHNLIVAASVVTLLFNGNPLMRFDGYYLLSDLIKIPNLGTKGQRFVAWASRRVLLGMKEETLPPAIQSRIGWIGVYGVLAALWKVVIWVGILFLISQLAKGAGIVLAVAAVAAAVVGAVKRLTKLFLKGHGGVRPEPRQAIWRLGSLSLLIVAALVFVPVSPSPRFVALVDQPDAARLRIDCDGFVREVLVENGSDVKAGQLLVRLENPAKELELGQARLELRRSRLLARQHFEEDRIASYQAELENQEGLLRRVEVLEEQIASLRVESPIDGVIHADRLDSLEGHYLGTGSLVVTVLPDAAAEVLVLVPQQSIEAFSRRNSEGLRLKLRGRPGSHGVTLERQERQATTALPRGLLASTAGGPLPVRQRPLVESDRERGLMEGRRAVALEQAGEEDPLLANLELATAHLRGYASFDESGPSFREGEWGYARLEGGQRYRLGAWLYDALLRYLEEGREAAGEGGALGAAG